MSAATNKFKVWTEFTSNMSGWEVGLNTTGFHHSGLLQDYAQAYRKAARRLFNALRETLVEEDQFNDHANKNAHQTVFLYRPALEVYLKTIIVFGNQLLWLHEKPLNPGRYIFTSHKLATLLPGVQEIFHLIDCSELWTEPGFHSFA